MLLLTISGASHGKCLKSTPWGCFWPYLVPSSENAQNQLLEATFDHIRGQAVKMLKIDFWRALCTISWNLLPSTWKMIPGACYQVLYTIYDILYTTYHIPYTIYYILYTIYYILYTIYYILYTIYYILYTQQQKLSESFPGKYFSPFLGPSNENAENLLPEITFDHFRG